MHLQDNFLNKVIEENISVSIYLLNGIKLQGNIHSFDQSVIVLNGQAPQLIFKHSISTIVPSKKVSLTQSQKYSKDLKMVRTQYQSVLILMILIIRKTLLSLNFLPPVQALKLQNQLKVNASFLTLNFLSAQGSQRNYFK